MPRSDPQSTTLPLSIANGGSASGNNLQKGLSQSILVSTCLSGVTRNEPLGLQNSVSGEELPQKGPDSPSLDVFLVGKGLRPSSRLVKTLLNLRASLGNDSSGENGSMRFFYPKFIFKREKPTFAHFPSQGDIAHPISKKGWRRRKKEAQSVKTEELKESDTVIVLMGPTGSGKSSFISMVADTDQGVGHDLMSCTNEIKAVRVRVPDEDIDIVLVDTPGFDDTYKSDYEILQMISEWIKQVGYKNILLDGILYLHRITDNRMAGTPLRNLEVFEKICGPQAFTRVLMMTTMWDDLENEEMGELREEELKTHYWYPMISQGSEAIRYFNSIDSAWKILDRFLDASKERLKAIQLQKETVKQQKALSKTDAGQELYNKLDELDKKRKTLIRKLEKQIKRAETNEEITGILQRQHDELEEQRKKAVSELQGLKVSVPQRFLKAFTVKMRYR
ncbi:hypothetical protein Ac2012v2_002386 [Leucoagaricus gongylophorus]